MMNIEKYLETHDHLVYSNKGVSMLPMLKEGRDLMIVRRKLPDERHQCFPRVRHHRQHELET